MTDRCPICAGSISINEAFRDVALVSSDCKHLRSGFEVGQCEDCGTIQKIMDQNWLAAVEEIYANYAPLHPGGVKDQLVFDQRTGQGRPRTEIIIETFLAGNPMLSDRGRLLDFGCGSGVFMESFSRFFPGWSMVGMDQSENPPEGLYDISGVEFYHCGSVVDLSGTFDLITMSHVLEHLPDPVSTLKALTAKLSDTGAIFLQVPNIEKNPFDLAIADHCFHFTADTLANVCQMANLKILDRSEDVNDKELSLLVATRGQVIETQASGSCDRVDEIVRWLQDVIENGKKLSGMEDFGIFGTSISAAWLDAQLERPAAFFCDEDSGRVGMEFLGRPIVDPKALPSGNVYVVNTPKISREITARMQNNTAHFYPTPADRLSAASAIG